MPSICDTGDSYKHVPSIGEAAPGKEALDEAHVHRPDNSQQENYNAIKPGRKGERETPQLLGVFMCVSASSSGGSQELLLPLSRRERL